MKLKIKHRVDEVFERIEMADLSDHIDLIEIESSTKGSTIFVIAKTIEDIGGFYEREYLAFDTEDEAYAWLDENGFNLLNG